MKKYILIIDYRGTSRYGYETLEANNLAEAILEVEDKIYGNRETASQVYLTKICEKTGRTESKNGSKNAIYTSKLCKRDTWHESDEAHSESRDKIRKNIEKDGYEWYEIVA